MKALRLATFPLVGILAYWLNLSDLSSRLSGSKNSPNTPNSLLLQQQSTPLPTRSGNALQRHPKSSEFQIAWDAIASQRLSREDRLALQKKLLADWSETDPEAALRAVLSEAWDNGPEWVNEFQPLLLAALENPTKNQPDLIWQLITSNAFGPLGGNRIQEYWFGTLAKHHPDLLTRYLPQLEKNELAGALNEACQELNRPELLKLWTSLRDFDFSQIKESYFVGEFSYKLSTEELLSLQKDGDSSNDRVVSLAIAFKHFQTDDQLKPEKLAEVPESLRDQLVYSYLEFQGWDEKILLPAMDLLVANERWDLLNQTITHEQIKTCANGNEADVAAMVANFPEREDLADLFHSGIKSYLGENPEAGWNWLSEFEPGLWRDRGFAELSQQALWRHNDPSLSRKALDQIKDPAFQAEAEAWRQNWEERQ